MKKLALILLLALLALPAQAQMFQTVPDDQATLLQDGPGRLYCPNCGMHLVKFYKTGHALPAADGATRQFCSLHCLVETTGEAAAATSDQALVVDVVSLEFIPVSQAFYVVGSDVKGTMTMKSKYAFADRTAAEAFAGEHGGQIMSFAEAAQVAAAGMEKENKAIAGKRAKMAEKGRAILEKMGGGEDLPEFSSIAEAKTHLKNDPAWSRLKDDQLQALAIYLVQGAPSAPAAQIQVPEKAKCPVCGMFVSKYPKWAAVIGTADGGRHYFDGVKDMMKFYLQPDQFGGPADAAALTLLQVTDYYTLAALDARGAWYVEGSNVYGPMGNELIPFATEEAARTFKEDHAGVRVLRFDEITVKLIRGLDR